MTVGGDYDHRINKTMTLTLTVMVFVDVMVK